MRTYRIVIGNSNDMREVKDRSIDLTVTSPPYLDLVKFRNGVKGELSILDTSKQFKEQSDMFFNDLKKNFEEIYRVTKTSGYLALEVEDYPVGSQFFGYPRELCLIGDFVKCVESTGFYLISRWYWKKYNQGAVTSKFQYILYDNLTNSDPRAVSNIAYCFVFRKFSNEKINRTLDFTKKEWYDWEDGIWYIENTVTELEAGEAVFPVELAKRLIRIYTNEGDTVLDPFLGTGTTMKAARLLGRNCIGYEIRPSMLPKIKLKVGVGQQSIDENEVINWEVIER